jgi:hypothetical protein
MSKKAMLDDESKTDWGGNPGVGVIVPASYTDVDATPKTQHDWMGISEPDVVYGGHL